MSERLLVATRKGLFTFDRSDEKTPSQWTIKRTAFLGDPVYMVLHDLREGWAYAALGHGHFGVKLHRSSDGGKKWEECAAPSYPKLADGEEEVRCPVRGIPIPSSLELVWSLEAGGDDEPGVLWCGTIPGGLFRTTDRGVSWELMRSLWDDPARRKWFGGGMDYPGIHSICVDPRDSKHVSVGVSCGGVWVTDDGGESWAVRAEGMWAAYMPPERKHDQSIQDPHRMVQCGADPEVLWVQHHNGVFRSTNGAASWREIKSVKPSAFGFAVAVHPDEPKTAWLVPAVSDEKRYPVEGRVVVARTRNGGESFDVLRNGLPQENAYDIVFRHALDVDASGNVLACGSTTGSLWLSDDQGDTWQTLSANLPPIYAVRFVK